MSLGLLSARHTEEPQLVLASPSECLRRDLGVTGGWAHPPQHEPFVLCHSLNESPEAVRIFEDFVKSKETDPADVVHPPHTGSKSSSSTFTLSGALSHHHHHHTTTTMKGLLLTLGLALICGIQATVIPQIQQDLDPAKVEGIWYTMAMAANKAALLETESASLRLYVQKLQPTADGNMEIILHKRVNDACVEMTIIAQKTEDPAVFTVDYLGLKDIIVLDTNYNSYLFFCLKTPTATEEQSMMCQYLARTLEMDTQVMGKFHQVLNKLPVHMSIFLDLIGKEGSAQGLTLHVEAWTLWPQKARLAGF
ncbi:PREDICTED: beta-lactoglobulin-2-like [Elephantulus edwardii]|uniref:beta-lactoglobulin-2-like n=1 Tax=Elephantulus edwardii TaxID=28737 RepID=UPI0003F08829|nr:PREDICTED: beta-lactoglobulin-2-like [Elephantulus edwardii]